MMRRRWIADQVSGNTAVLVGEHASHLASVLRAELGQEFDVATGNAVRRGKITSISDDRVEFSLGEEEAVPSVPQVALALAIFKFDRMEWAIEKCTEIGVASIIPVVARRTDARLASAAKKRHERWQRIALQAAEQSRRMAPPEIAAPVKLRDLNRARIRSRAGIWSATKPEDDHSICRIVLAESEGKRRLRDALIRGSKETILAIGPEGGWSEDELQWFREAGWSMASLGPTILRTETAAIVAAALVLDEHLVDPSPGVDT
jgi:16S rRNA (uracil1498-N3)-methyltransferase